MNTLLIFIYLFLSTTVCTGDSSIIVTEKVVASSCRVNEDSLSNQVELPQAKARDMTDAGSGGEWVGFILLIDDCLAALTTAKAIFSGDKGSNDPTLFKNQGDAENVALQLVARSTTYGNGSIMKTAVSSTPHKAYFSLSAHIYSPMGYVVKGRFSRVVGVISNNIPFTHQKLWLSRIDNNF